MGIFARNRTQLSEIELEYSSDYTCESDLLDSMVESYIDDYALFETLLHRDLLESVDVISESGDSNILTRIWEGILKIIGELKSKINSVIESVCDAIDKLKSDYYDKTIKKTESQYDKADLSGFTIRNLKLFNYSEFLKCKELETVLDKVVSLDIQKLKDQPIETITLQKNKDFAVYDNLKSSIHDVIWYKTNSDHPFKEHSDLKGIIKTILRERATENTALKRAKKRILDHLDKQEKEAKKMLKEAKKEKNVDKVKKDYNIKFAKECNDIVNQARRVSVGVINTVLSEYKKIVSTSAKIYKAASKYAIKQLKKNGSKEETKEEKKVETPEESYIDIDYLTAIAEATEYEFEMCMENLTYTTRLDLLQYN